MRLFFIGVLCCLCGMSFAQEKEHTSYIDINYFKGNIALHNNDILHLITGHPEGFIISYNKKNLWSQCLGTAL
jgi:hypothetical protein